MTAPAVTQRTIAAIAADVIAVGVGGRLPTSLEYQAALNVGSGTVQQAVRTLEAAAALGVVSQGHLGRRVTDADVGRLWSLAGFGPVRLILPPPGALELYGFMECVRDQFDRSGIPLNVTHQRGAAARLAAVRDGAVDAALLSSGAAGDLRASAQENGLALVGLGPDSYYAPDTIVVLGDRDREHDGAGGLRVGIDHQSHDHQQLTEAEFPPGDAHRYVECDFPSMPVAVLRGRVDVGIWHRALLLISPELAGVPVSPLAHPEAWTARRRLSQAVVVHATARPEVAAVCAQLDTEAIRSEQRRLLDLDPDAGELDRRYWLR